ncbi:hypothetical protein K503DRAFT_773633 [Rhizopogon vinicolor AM-OR11-026]|uniref:Uncharacterized protein n=1 Tax=Rhizopogon vinicolor AM-OR11-026 TaxID=1314800 RepID=A0A1B7MRR8_9AGAM|nr:hypothetical protein K503DRAFT_773633 [Rhizopogon vinicolor AM-OR11-026]
MDDLSCLGCGKAFTTQKRLSGHEASCDANKRFDIVVYKRQRRLEKDRRKKDRSKRQRVHKDTSSPERNAKNASSLPDADVQVDIDNDLYSDIVYEPGPSGSNAVPVSPAPDAPPVIVSARSGRRIRMPARYTDYLPATTRHILHVPPTNPQDLETPAREERVHSPPTPTNGNNVSGEKLVRLNGNPL